MYNDSISCCCLGMGEQGAEIIKAMRKLLGVMNILIILIMVMV